MPPELLDEELEEEEDEEELELELEDDELLETFPLDVETFPLEVETPPVDVETPPVEVDTPPVEVDTPPVEVETPPVVELVELLMPPVELLVDEITTDPPPPPPLPPKKPPMNPPPKPPPPAITIGAAPPPDITGISAGGKGAGKGMGGAWVVTVTVCGAQEVTVFTTFRLTGRGAGAAFMLLLLWTTAGRALSATWTAPPPTSAPPQVQAHNLANAIRTDIGIHSCCLDVLWCGYWVPVTTEELLLWY